MKRSAITFCLGSLAALTGGCATHHDPHALSRENQAIRDAAQDEQARHFAAARQCGEELKSSESFAALRGKVELVRTAEESPPADIAANDRYPTAAEREAIAAWARARQQCQLLSRETETVLPFTSRSVALYWAQVWDINRGVAASVDALVVALSQGRLTYGEFAQKRCEIDGQSQQIKLDLYEAAVAADNKRDDAARREALISARDAFQARLRAWSSYMQSVNSRPIGVPQQAVVER
jgi:hypothetical protein